jgi:hypothetical protein
LIIKAARFGSEADVRKGLDVVINDEAFQCAHPAINRNSAPSTQRRMPQRRSSRCSFRAPASPQTSLNSFVSSSGGSRVPVDAGKHLPVLGIRPAVGVLA